MDVFKSNLGRARNGVSYHPTMHRPDGSWSTDENQGEMDIKTNLTDNCVHEVELPKLDTAGWEHICRLLARGQAILLNS